MPWVDLDQFVIRKGHGVFDVFDFINAMLSADNVEDGFANLRDSHHDLSQSEFTGVEADAVKIAVERGLIDPSITNIINEGPDPNNPKRWRFAFLQAMQAGAPIINEAIRKTNEMNKAKADATGRGHTPIPDAFIPDPTQRRQFKVADAWTQAVVGDLQDGATHNQYGQLITQYKSKRTQKPESYARPYWQGLHEDRKQRNPNVKAPTPSKSISPGILHTDTISFTDSNLRFVLGQAVIDVKKNNPGLSREQLIPLAMQQLQAMPRFQKFGGLRHTRGLEHGKYSDDNLAAMEVAQVSDMASDPNVSYDYMNTLHPELRENAFMNYDSNSHYHGKNADDPMPRDKKVIQGLKDKHGFDDEAIQRVFADAHSGNYKGSKKQRILQAIHAEEMRDGKPPTWVDPSMAIPPGGAIQSPITEQASLTETTAAPSGRMGPRSQGGQQVIPPAGTPPAATAPSPSPDPLTPPPPMNPTPPPPPENAAMVGAFPAPSNPAPPPVPQANAYAQPHPASVLSGRGSRMSRLLNQLGYHYESLFPNFSKSDDQDDEKVLKEMLEDVQMRIAKEEVGVVAKHSIGSVSDVALVATQMRRPSSDIITIVHSRGNWENLAKSIGMAHSEVQRVKVMFDE